jgi:hypothetical protein
MTTTTTTRTPQEQEPGRRCVSQSSRLLTSTDATHILAVKCHGALHQIEEEALLHHEEEEGELAREGCITQQKEQRSSDETRLHTLPDPRPALVAQHNAVDSPTRRRSRNHTKLTSRSG